MKHSRTSELCDELARIVEQTYLSQDQFESVFLQLSPAERRLYCLLNEHESARASEICRLVSIANISQVAARVNAKLEQAGDTRRLESARRSVTDDYGLTHIESVWTMVDNGKGVDSESDVT